MNFFGIGWPELILTIVVFLLSIALFVGLVLLIIHIVCKYDAKQAAKGDENKR